MTAPTDQLTDFATRTQQFATDAVRTWADSVQGVVGAVAGGRAVPDAHVVVDRWFDAAQQVLDQQRHLAQSVVTAGTAAAETVTSHATGAAETVDGAAKDAGRSTKSATRS